MFYLTGEHTVTVTVTGEMGNNENLGKNEMG